MDADLEQLRQYLAPIINRPVLGREVEARFNVTGAQFYQTQQRLSLLPLKRRFYRDTLFPNDIRKRAISIDPAAHPLIIEWSRKVKDRPFDSVEFAYRVGVSIETTVSPLASEEKNQGIRTSWRSSFDLVDGLRLDFIEDTTTGKSQYRIEAEVTSSNPNVLVIQIPHIISLIHDTFIPVGMSERIQVIQAYNSLMEGKKSSFSERLLRGSLPHPEDLTLNELYMGEPWSRSPISVTPKADGEVMELLFIDTGIYAVSGQKINKLLNNRIGSIVPALYQGEMVEPFDDEEIVSAYTFVVFETLFVKGSPLRATADLVKRHEYQKALLSLFGRDHRRKDLTILLKPFPIAKTTDEFYANNNTILNSSSTLPYPTDGLVLTEVAKPYMKGEIKIWKVKERQNLTIDLRVRPDHLLVDDDRPEHKGEVPFEGNHERPFSITRQEIKRLVDTTPYLTYGDIWEFEFDAQFRPTPRRPRYNKNGPNRWTTAQNIWKLLLHPVEFSTIRGHDLTLMRRYHNRVKEGLFETLQMGSTYLDLGSGRGGDLHKMNGRNLKVYLLEPNKDNRKELENRVRNGHYQNMVRGLADYGAEETDLVLDRLLKKQQVDAVGLFFVLTFFFKQPDMLVALVDTIAGALKVGGKLLVATADSDQVLAAMRGAKKIETPAYQIERRGRELFLNFPDTIVGEQQEWLADLITFQKLLAEHQIVPVKQRSLTNTKNLPLASRLLSGMYSTVEYIRKHPMNVPRNVPMNIPVNVPVAEEEKVVEEENEEEEVEEENEEEEVEEGEENKEEENKVADEDQNLVDLLGNL